MQGLGLPKELLQLKSTSFKTFKEPNCDLTDLPFNMGTYDHFEVYINILLKENCLIFI